MYQILADVSAHMACRRGGPAGAGVREQRGQHHGGRIVRARGARARVPGRLLPGPAQHAGRADRRRGGTSAVFPPLPGQGWPPGSL